MYLADVNFICSTAQLQHLLFSCNLSVLKSSVICYNFLI